MRIKGRVIRLVTVEAQDMSEGMTVGELMDAICEVPASLVPIVEIKMNGKIKRIKFRISVVPDA